MTLNSILKVSVSTDVNIAIFTKKSFKENYEPTTDDIIDTFHFNYIKSDKDHAVEYMNFREKYGKCNVKMIQGGSDYNLMITCEM